jgi:hypothetical protein
MPIPHAETAYVPLEKLSGYLLDEDHPVGGSKARWFRGRGYDPSDAAALERDLLKVVQSSENYTEKSSSFGKKYVVSGKITSPQGTEGNVVTVWIVESIDNKPRLVTAYPGEKS